MTQYYDPKNEPGNEKKLLLAFLLVFVGIAVMQFLTPKPAPAPAKPEPPQEQPATPPAQTSTTPPAVTPSTPQKPQPTSSKNSTSKKKTAPAVPEAAPSKQATSETKTVVDNPYYRIVFSNRGAVVTSWILKKY